MNGSGRGFFGAPMRPNNYFGPSVAEADSAQEFVQIRAQLSRIETILLEYFVHAKPSAGGDEDLRRIVCAMGRDMDCMRNQLDAMRAEMDKTRKERE